MHNWTQRLLISILFIFFWNTCFSNDYKKDTTIINNWLNESKKHLYTQPDSANLILDSVFNKSIAINYSKGIYSAHVQRGITYFMKSQYEESILEYLKGSDYANPNVPYEEIRILSNISYSLRALNLIDSALYYNEQVLILSKKHQLLEIYQQTILDLAHSYLDKENYIKSAELYQQVINDIETAQDKDYLLKAYSSIALFYYRLNDFDNSYYYFIKAINHNKKHLELDFLSINYANLGLLYQKVKKDYDSAIYYYNTSLLHTKDYDREVKTLIANINIGNCYIDQDNIDSSYSYYQKAINSDLIENHPVYKAAVYTNLGMYYLAKLNFQEARDYLQKGLSISKELEHLEFQQKAHYSLFELDSILNNNTAALYHYRNYHRIFNKRKIQEVKKSMAILDYEKFIATEKYNNQLLLKENQNQNQQIIIQKIIIAIVILVLLVLVIITSLVFKNRKKINKLNSQLKNSNSNLEELNNDLKLQKNDMKELLMSKDRFVSILGHDLKNPFTGLLGLLELIQQDWDEIDEQEKKEGIKQLHQSSIQTYQLLEELLDWGKTQQGLIKPQKSRLQILEIFQNVENLFHLQLKEKNITVNIQASQNNYIETDKKLLSQIIQNLFGNAIKYSYPNSKISLLVKENDKELSICVKDSGIGIPEEKIKILFNLDKHFNRPGTQNEKSTGMGLILCKEYANIIDAQISVESKENSGSTFCLVFSKIKHS